jgi:HPt (histidine-containing phosphotransfer) domain-containing protein
MLCIDLDAVLARCGGDYDLLGTLAGMFPTESRKLLNALEQARAAGDLHGVQINAHTLKGMCGIFEATQAAGAAFELEHAAGAGNLGTDQEVEALRAELVRAIEAVTQLQPEHSYRPLANSDQVSKQSGCGLGPGISEGESALL